MKKIVVLAKQVPDTANITGQAMKDDGPVNRGKLPAIFNPEDLNGLQMALDIKEKIGAEVHVVTMGPARAVEILKHSLYLGADKVVLVSDRKFAGADTLATSYVLSEAVKKIGNVDMVIAGRQAIDGDTAQVGPQVADKIGFNQITYVSKLNDVTENYVIVERDGEVQTEEIKSQFPVLLTVTEEANTPGYPSCVHMRNYFQSDLTENFSPEELPKAEAKGLVIPTFNSENMGLDTSICGLGGSPTKVKKIKSITLTGGDLEMFEANDSGVKLLIDDIMKEYTEAN
jgi:electron transfer flavoprotein beta subunit